MKPPPVPTDAEIIGGYRQLPLLQQGLIQVLLERVHTIPPAELTQLAADVLATPFEGRTALIAEYLAAGGY